MYRHIACGIVMGLLLSISIAAEVAKQLGGRVIDEKGHPVAGAKVMAFETKAKAMGGREDHELGSVVTGADGRFVFDARIGASLVTIVATKEGKCLDWADWYDARAPESVLQLGPAATIEGKIVNEAGEPVAGASVDALLRMETPTVRQMHVPLAGGALKARTDAQGRFRFVNLPEAAIVTFDMSAAGRARALAKGHFIPGQKGLRFVLPPEGRLEGTVVEKGTGKPLADVCLWAAGSLTSGVHQASARTDKEGHFSMAGLSGGKYEIEIVGAGRALPEWLGSQKKVQVETGKVTSGVKIEATRGGTLELVLTDAATSKPIAAAASVTVCPAEDLRIRKWGFASKDGMARLHLLPGKYVVTDVWVTGYSWNQEKSKSFRVEAGKTERATLAVKAVPQVTGIVRDLAGKPVPRAKVQILPLRGAPKDLVAGDDGRFSIDSADIGPLFCFISVRHPQQNLVAIEGVGKDDKRPEIKLQPPTKVSGVVLDSQGRPVGGASVQAQIDASHFGRFAVVAMARTDKEGRYRMELGGTSMSYAISAKAPSFSVAETLVPQHQLVQGQVKVKDLVLKAADRVVRGVVKDAQGMAVAGVIVLAKPMRGPDFPGSAVTDGRGQFALKHLNNAPVIYLFAKVPGRGWIGDSTIKPGDTEVVIKVGPSHYD